MQMAEIIQRQMVNTKRQERRAENYGLNVEETSC